MGSVVTSGAGQGQGLARWAFEGAAFPEGLTVVGGLVVVDELEAQQRGQEFLHAAVPVDWGVDGCVGWRLGVHTY